MDSTAIQAIDSTLRQLIDTSYAHAADLLAGPIADSTTRCVIDSMPNWLVDYVWPPVAAGVVSLIIWWFTDRSAKRRRRERDREHCVRVWGLALFELREAINRSISYSDRFRTDEASLGVLYFAKTVSSDYFKSYVSLSEAAEMHWLYGMLNQIQENVNTSRAIDEANCAGKSIYAGAASAFANEYEAPMVEKFNRCVDAWRNYCKKYDVAEEFAIEDLPSRTEDNNEGEIDR